MGGAEAIPISFQFSGQWRWVSRRAQPIRKEKHEPNDGPRIMLSGLISLVRNEDKKRRILPMR
jgi:hypothetical protein